MLLFGGVDRVADCISLTPECKDAKMRLCLTMGLRKDISGGEFI